MAKQILNIINQFMAYTPTNGITDNPVMRNFDWARRIYSVPVDNAQADTKLLAPGQTLEIFSGLVPHTISVGQDCVLKSLGDSVYRLEVDTTSAFRLHRPVSALTTVNVTVNNQAIAIFEFVGATIGAMVGDIMRCKGYKTKDANTAWNAVNTGDWVIIGANGNKLTCKRPLGQDFEAIEESPTITAADVAFFSAAGIQNADNITLDNFLLFGKQSFVVQDVTNNTIDFVSGQPLPVDDVVAYVTDKITFNNKTKKFFYIEANNSVAVQFNGDTGENVVVEPIVYNDENAPGFFTKFGAVHACSVKNLTLEPVTITFLTAE